MEATYTAVAAENMSMDRTLSGIVWVENFDSLCTRSKCAFL